MKNIRILTALLLALPSLLVSCNKDNSPTFPIIIEEEENNDAPLKAQLIELSSYSYKNSEASYKISGSINNSSSTDIDYFAIPLKYNSDVDITFSCEDRDISFIVEKLVYDTFSTTDNSFLPLKETLTSKKI